MVIGEGCYWHDKPIYTILFSLYRTHLGQESGRNIRLKIFKLPGCSAGGKKKERSFFWSLSKPIRSFTGSRCKRSSLVLTPSFSRASTAWCISSWGRPMGFNESVISSTNCTIGSSWMKNGEQFRVCTTSFI